MGRGPVIVIMVSVLCAGTVALVIAKPALFERILPPSVLAYADVFGADAVAPVTSKGTGEAASDYLFDTPDGVEARGPIAAAAGNEAVFITDVITGYSARVSDAVPSAITTIRPILGCAVTPPLAGSIVGHATAGQGGVGLAISTYNDDHLAAAVQVFVDAYRQTGAVEAVLAEGNAYRVYDVAVTETRAPVYLVLEQAGGNRIWNIHLAEGARIERVILLGGAQAGVANLDPLVPVEVMLADGLQTCGIKPTYPPSAGALSQDGMDQALARIAVETQAYDAWFAASFGVTAAQSRVGWDRGAVSVIGPLPVADDPLADWAALAGSEIRTTQDKFFEIRGQVAEGTDFASRVRAIATTFAFGDLDYLRQAGEF